jgi:uncharacterized protein (DUF952 family)
MTANGFCINISGSRFSHPSHVNVQEIGPKISPAKIKSSLCGAGAVGYLPIMDTLIFKILTAAQWAKFQEDGIFTGAPIDLADGYIHISTAAQARETAAKHFAQQDGLILAAVKVGSLSEALKYEVSRGGALFPHYYAPLLIDHIAWAKPLLLDDKGTHIFPEGFDQ